MTGSPRNGNHAFAEGVPSYRLTPKMAEISDREYPTDVYDTLSSLDTIRILRLYPSTSFQDPLEFDFLYKERSLLLTDPQGQSYDAVSYAWGEPTFTNSIRYRGRDTVVKITAHVDTMMRYLRKKYTSRHLWIDAICLNQNDNEEKSMQVQLMDEIYSQARKVRIWFGDEDTPEVFGFLRTLALRERQLSSISPDAVTKTLRLFGADSIHPVEMILCNAWFKRRWVLQEAILNPITILHCGRYKMDWRWFISGLKVLLSVIDGLYLSAAAREALAISNSLQNNSGDLLQNLWDFHENECSDPRDRILALQGLSSSRNDGLPSGYSSYSLEWNHLYRIFAEVQIGKQRTAELLFGHVNAFGSLWLLNGSWPSWVPNWSTNRKYHCDASVWKKHHVKAELTDGMPLPGLKIHAERVAVVTRTAKPLPVRSSRRELLRYLRDCLHTNERLAKKSSRGLQFTGREQRQLKLVLHSIDLLRMFCAGLFRFTGKISNCARLISDTISIGDSWLDDSIMAILILAAWLHVIGSDGAFLQSEKTRTGEDISFASLGALSRLVVRYVLCRRRGWNSRLGTADPELQSEQTRMDQEVRRRHDKYTHCCHEITTVFLPEIEKLLREGTIIRAEYEGVLQKHSTRWIGPAGAQDNDVIVRPCEPEPGWPYDSVAFVLRPDFSVVDTSSVQTSGIIGTNDKDCSRGAFWLVGCAVGVLWPEPHKSSVTKEFIVR